MTALTRPHNPPVNSIALGGDGQANHALALLRSEDKEGSLKSDMSFGPGIELHAAAAAGLSGSYCSPRGALLDFNAKISGLPDGWIALHVAVPMPDIVTAGIFGFVARVRAPELQTARACLRSGTEEGFVDAFFDKHLVARPEAASHLDAMSLPLREDIPHRAAWREFILFLPKRDFQLSLIDLRLFLA